MAGQIKVDSINADSNLALKIANTAVAFIDSSGLRPTSGNVSLDATATSKLYLPSANTVAIQTAGVTAVTVDSSQNTTLAGTLTTTGITNSGVATGARFNPTGSSATGNGMYLPAANSLGLSTNGTNAVYIDSSQNVGIGTTSPSTYGKLVSYAGDIATVKAHGSGSYPTIIFQNATAGTTFSGRLLWKDGNGNAGWNVGQNVAVGSGYLEFNDGATNRMCIDSSGNLLVGATSQVYNERFGVSANNATADSNIAYFVHKSTNNPRGYRVEFLNAAPNNTTQTFTIFGDNAANRFVVYSNGNVVNTNNSYGALSDVKLKENITDASPKLDSLMRVRVVNYNLIGEQTKQIGVVAQELEQVFPSMVDESPDIERVTTTDEDGNETTNEVPTGTATKSVKYSVFVPMLVKAIQELKQINDTQAETINALTARIVALETI